jgi:hypothetical protein
MFSYPLSVIFSVGTRTKAGVLIKFCIPRESSVNVVSSSVRSLCRILETLLCNTSMLFFWVVTPCGRARICPRFGETLSSCLPAIPHGVTTKKKQRRRLRCRKTIYVVYFVKKMRFCVLLINTKRAVSPTSVTPELY